MKKVLAIVLSTGLAAGLLAGCGSSSGSQTTTAAATAAAETAAAENGGSSGDGTYADFPTKNITYICSGSAGGGLDLCARMISPYLEKYLPGNGTVTVENVTGGQNWTAWTRLIQSQPDGYTISTLATPQFTNYLNKSLQVQYTMDDYTPLANCVTDYCCISVRADDERFENVSNLTELVEYLKENSDTDFLVSLTSGGGADELAMYEIMRIGGVDNLVGINYADGVNASRTGFLGEETDIYSGKIGDTLSMYQDGTAKVLAVLADERSEILPEVATGAEQGFDITLGSSRGIIVPNGMDPELFATLEEAVKEASEDPEYLKLMADGGYEVDYMGSADYKAYLEEVKTMVEGYADVLGYNN